MNSIENDAAAGGTDEVHGSIIPPVPQNRRQALLDSVSIARYCLVKFPFDREVGEYLDSIGAIFYRPLWSYWVPEEQMEGLRVVMLGCIGTDGCITDAVDVRIRMATEVPVESKPEEKVILLGGQEILRLKHKQPLLGRGVSLIEGEIFARENKPWDIRVGFRPSDAGHIEILVEHVSAKRAFLMESELLRRLDEYPATTKMEIIR